MIRENQPNDTIVAVATPPGQGGVGIVRLSGPDVIAITQTVLGQLPKPRYATLSRFMGARGEDIDQGIALFFPAPHSFTGEDVLELQGHGGPVVLDLLVQRVIELGARLAQPGEFSERAFLNDKLDLVQAEAVADLIASSSEAAARSALRSLQGDFSREIHGLVDELIQLRMFVEGSLDFPDEELELMAAADVENRLEAVAQKLDSILASAQQGRLLIEGLTVVLLGEPNVGKSSLFNALSRIDHAIVSESPGTTRDIIRAPIQIDGLPIHILDTAGLRSTDNTVEGEGVRRARAALDQADQALLILDDAADQGLDDIIGLAQVPDKVGITIVRNKIDLSRREPGLTEENGHPLVAISVKTGAGLDDLRQHLKSAAGYQSTDGAIFAARRRHLEALERASNHVGDSYKRLKTPDSPELIAEELRLAQISLSQITGEFTSDDLLGEIFSHFCIGK